jgi:hypothetical protein
VRVLDQGNGDGNVPVACWGRGLGGFATSTAGTFAMCKQRAQTSSGNGVPSIKATWWWPTRRQQRERRAAAFNAERRLFTTPLTPA